MANRACGFFHFCRFHWQPHEQSHSSLSNWLRTSRCLSLKLPQEKRADPWWNVLTAEGAVHHRTLLHLVDSEMPHVQTEHSPTAFFFFSSDDWSAFHFPTCQKTNKAFVPLISSNDPGTEGPESPGLEEWRCPEKRPSAPNEVPGATWDCSAARSRRG